MHVDEPANAAGRRVYVRFRHLWGKSKRAELLAGGGAYQELTPVVEMGLPFMPGQVAAGYVAWPALPDLFPISFPGVKTSRDDFLVDTDRNRLLARLKVYFDPTVSHAEMRQINPGVMEDTARFKGELVRDTLRKRGFLPDNIVRYCYRPFDVRWLYWEPETKLLDEKRSEYFPHVFDGTFALVAQQKPRREWSSPQFISRIGCLDLMDRGASCIPLCRLSDGTSLLEPAGKKPNLSEAAAVCLAGLGVGPEDLFYHALAVLHAPVYRIENAGALRQDWPRIPLPGFGKVEAASRRFPAGDLRTRRDAASTLQTSAALGRQVAALLDSETQVPGVTAGKIRDDLRRIAVFQRLDGKPAQPEAGDLDLMAGWGHAGKGGVCMPGRGRVIASEPSTVNTHEEPRTLNPDAYDVHLNDVACWRNIPAPVWEFTIGGYQVIKKWLSYREKPLLGRGLTPDEVRHVTDTARRIAVLVSLQSDLDASYRAVAGAK